MGSRFTPLPLVLLPASSGFSLLSCASPPKSAEATTRSPNTKANRDYSRELTEKLIDELMNVSSAGPGSGGTANFEGFIADDGPYRFTYGVIGSPPPQVDRVMRELVRRGYDALPVLLRHLNDDRATKLSVGARFSDALNGGGGFVFFSQTFSEEYDAKMWSPEEKPCFFSDDCPGKGFDEAYVLRVGDLCFSLIGQIVNRHLNPVRYQPTANLVVNSPVQNSALAARTRRDWDGVGATELRRSLLEDLHDDEERWRSALPRLRLYFLDEYNRLSGLDLKERLAFEFDERASRKQEGVSRDAGPYPSITRGIDSCSTLSRCIDALDRNVRNEHSIFGHEYQIAQRLLRFGDPAKKALLERLTDPDRNWRVFAIALLAHWPTLSESDLPALTATLQMDRTNFVFEALAKIDSPAALRLMVAEVRRYGDRSLAREPLADLGPRALPNLLPILADPDLWRTAADVVSEMRGAAAVEATHWASIAADDNAPREERVAALRGLAAMKEFGRPAREIILPVARANDETLRRASLDALQAIAP